MQFEFPRILPAPLPAGRMRAKELAVDEYSLDAKGDFFRDEGDDLEFLGEVIFVSHQLDLLVT